MHFAERDIDEHTFHLSVTYIPSKSPSLISIQGRSFFGCLHYISSAYQCLEEELSDHIVIQLTLGLVVWSHEDRPGFKSLHSLAQWSLVSGIYTCITESPPSKDMRPSQLD